MKNKKENKDMTFAEKLYKLRTDKGLSQKELALRAGLSQTAIYYWEKGERKPKIEQLQKIATILRISINDLLENTFADTPNDVSEDKPFSFPTLEKKVEEIGYRIIYGTYENSDGVKLSPGDIFIKYPDGKQIFITPSELENLNDDTDSYLKFKLEELRKKKQK